MLCDGVVSDACLFSTLIAGFGGLVVLGCGLMNEMSTFQRHVEYLDDVMSDY